MCALAALDVDNSLFNRFIAHDFLEEAVKEGLFAKDSHKDIHSRDPALSADERSQLFAQYLSEGFSGADSAKVKELAGKMARRFIEKNSFRNLLKALMLLHEKGMKIALISLAPHVLVEAIGNEIRSMAEKEGRTITVLPRGTKLEEVDGKYSGKLEGHEGKEFHPHTQTGKMLTLLHLAKELREPIHFAYGDSISDLGMLRMARASAILPTSREAGKEADRLRIISSVWSGDRDRVDLYKIFSRALKGKRGSFRYSREYVKGRIKRKSKNFLRKNKRKKI